MPFKKSNPGYTVKPAPVLEICALLLRGDAHHCPLSPIASEVLRSTSTWGLVLNSFYILYVYALGHVILLLICFYIWKTISGRYKA